MSYSRILKPTEEAMKKYHSFADEEFLLDSANVNVTKIIAAVLKPSTNNIEDTIYLITKELRTIEMVERNLLYRHMENMMKDGGEIYFNGWTYANDVSDIDINTYRRDTIQRLAILAHAIDKPSYLDDSEKFSNLWIEIDEIIRAYGDSVYESETFNVINDLKEFDVTNKDDDELLNPKTEDDEL